MLVFSLNLLFIAISFAVCKPNTDPGVKIDSFDDSLKDLVPNYPESKFDDSSILKDLSNDEMHGGEIEEDAEIIPDVDSIPVSFNEEDYFAYNVPKLDMELNDGLYSYSKSDFDKLMRAIYPTEYDEYYFYSDLDGDKFNSYDDTESLIEPFSPDHIDYIWTDNENIFGMENKLPKIDTQFPKNNEEIGTFDDVFKHILDKLQNEQVHNEDAEDSMVDDIPDDEKFDTWSVFYDEDSDNVALKDRMDEYISDKDILVDLKKLLEGKSYEKKSFEKILLLEDDSNVSKEDYSTSLEEDSSSSEEDSSPSKEDSSSSEEDSSSSSEEDSSSSEEDSSLSEEAFKNSLTEINQLRKSLLDQNKIEEIMDKRHPKLTLFQTIYQIKVFHLPPQDSQYQETAETYENPQIVEPVDETIDEETIQKFTDTLSDNDKPIPPRSSFFFRSRLSILSLFGPLLMISGAFLTCFAIIALASALRKQRHAAKKRCAITKIQVPYRELQSVKSEI